MSSETHCGAGRRELFEIVVFCDIGAGNSFLGGLGAGLALTGGDVVQGAFMVLYLIVWPNNNHTKKNDSDIPRDNIGRIHHRTTRHSAPDLFALVPVLRRIME